MTVKKSAHVTEPAAEMSPELLRGKIMTMLQFARKAGLLAYGFESCRKHLLSGKMKLMIYTEDISQNTQDRIRAALGKTQADIPVRKFSTQEELSTAMGLPFTGIVGILDHNFARKILSYFNSH
jgi:ribosomal protein L7Ae-like RNA K-turn-binding protein